METFEIFGKTVKSVIDNGVGHCAKCCLRDICKAISHTIANNPCATEDMVTMHHFEQV